MACYHAKWRLAQTTRIFKHSLTELLAWLIFLKYWLHFVVFHFIFITYITLNTFCMQVIYCFKECKINQTWNHLSLNHFWIKSLYVCVSVCVRPGEFCHTMVAQDRDRSRGADGHGEQGIRTQVPGASVGEDRAILLGCTMMAFSVLMFFVVGITMIKPFVNRYTGECCLVSRLSYKCKGLFSPCLCVQRRVC